MIGIGIGIPVIRTLGKGGNAHVYDLRSEMVVDEDAPLTSPHTNVPGPGTLVITDTEDKFSISGDQLVCAGGKATPAIGDPGAWTQSSYARVAGLALLAKVDLSLTDKILQIGFDSNQTGGAVFPSIIFNAFGVIVSQQSGTTVGSLGAYSATEYKTAIVLRSTGAFLFIKGGTFVNWTLLWVWEVGTTDPIFGAISNLDQQFSSDFLRVLDLPANGYPIWSDDYGIATDRLAGARSASDTFTHTADCIIEFETTTLPSADTVRLIYRQQDSVNNWFIFINTAGDLVLFERVAGTPTERGSVAGVLVGGERIVVVIDSNVHRIYYDNTLAFTYTDPSSLFVTETSGELLTLGTGGAVSDIVAWPRIIRQLANTDLLAGAVPNATTFVHDSDCRIVFTIDTLPSSGDVVVEFRRQDANDYWRVLINSVGDLVLQKVLNGVSQGNHILGSGVLSGGERVTVVAHENHYILLFDDTLVGTHDDSFVLFNGFTGGRAGLGIGGVVDDLVTWPLPSNAGDEAYISLEAASA